MSTLTQNEYILKTRLFRTAISKLRRTLFSVVYTRLNGTIFQTDENRINGVSHTKKRIAQHPHFLSTTDRSFREKIFPQQKNGLSPFFWAIIKRKT